MMKMGSVLLALSGLAAGCTAHQYAKSIKLVAFEDDIHAGRSVGPVRGASCQAHAMGIPIGDPISLDRAMARARAKHKLRYMNNVSTDSHEFESYFYGKRCLEVKGTGYR